MKKLGFVLAAAFLAAACQSPEERAAAEAARAARVQYEQQEISAAKDRIDAIAGRFEWNVRRTGTRRARRTRCDVTDRQDGSKYRVTPGGPELQSGPGGFLKQGTLFRSGSTCVVVDNATRVFCETRSSDVPACRPQSLMPDSYKR